MSEESRGHAYVAALVNREYTNASRVIMDIVTTALREKSSYIMVDTLSYTLAHVVHGRIFLPCRIQLKGLLTPGFRVSVNVAERKEECLYYANVVFADTGAVFLAAGSVNSMVCV